MAIKKNITVAANKKLLQNIKLAIEQTKAGIINAVNTQAVYLNFEIGKLIIEHEQKGKLRAEYAATTLQLLSDRLQEEFGRGYSVDSLENMRKFFLLYQKSETASRKSIAPKSETLSRKLTSPKSETASRKLTPPMFKLTWSHYVQLIRLETQAERAFYEIEATNETWNVRELKRQIDSALYERLALSRNKKQVKELSKKGLVIEKPEDAIKDPYILNMFGLKPQDTFTENDLENALIGKLEFFLEELGKGFLFVERQQNIQADGDNYYIDLVFYHRILKCFVLIDLKIGELKPADVAQMMLYVNMYDDKIKMEAENPTIGIILCKSKKESLVKYTVGKDNKQIFASQYKLHLPTKQQFIKVIEAPKRKTNK